MRCLALTVLLLTGCSPGGPDAPVEPVCEIAAFCGDNLNHTLWCIDNIVGPFGLAGSAFSDPYCIEFFRTGNVPQEQE